MAQREARGAIEPRPGDEEIERAVDVLGLLDQGEGPVHFVEFGEIVELRQIELQDRRIERLGKFPPA
ncbi:hypothetical protein D3C72_1829140 [compost metagenome]